MQDITEAFWLALGLVVAGDADLFEIVGLSLYVSGAGLIFACLIGYPLGALLAVTRFSGRRAALAALNALMSLPAVVVGLFVYIHLSRAGPLGWLGLLYSPAAMIIAQTILITPLIAALSRVILEEVHRDYAEQLRSLAAPPLAVMGAVLWDARSALATVALAGFGRAVAEVGAVIIVGGNIDHLTRVMTTAIALETSKGDLPMALALGLVLMGLALAINLAAEALRPAAHEAAHA